MSLSKTDLSELLRKALRAGGRLVDSDRCALFLMDDARNELYARVFDERSVRAALGLFFFFLFFSFFFFFFGA